MFIVSSYAYLFDKRKFQINSDKKFPCILNQDLLGFLQVDNNLNKQIKYKEFIH